MRAWASTQRSHRTQTGPAWTVNSSGWFYLAGERGEAWALACLSKESELSVEGTEKAIKDLRPGIAQSHLCFRKWTSSTVGGKFCRVQATDRQVSCNDSENKGDCPELKISSSVRPEISSSSDKLVWRYTEAEPWEWRCVCVSVLSLVPLFSVPWTVARQALLSMGFSRQEYWSGLPFPPRGGLLNPGVARTSLASPALAGGFFTTSATWDGLFVYKSEIHTTWTWHLHELTHLFIWYFLYVVLRNLRDTRLRCFISGKWKRDFKAVVLGL